MADNNAWLISLTIVAVVAIVAVFGLVRMTGYTIGEGDFYGKGGTSYMDITGARMMDHQLEAKLLKLKMKTLIQLRAAGYTDINPLWVTLTYEDKALIGLKVYNVDGTYNADATAFGNDYLTRETIGDNTIFALTSSQVNAILGLGIGEPLGLEGDIGAY